jgi:hypothetical protein
VHDSTGQALAYIYSREDATIARQAGVLTMEARRGGEFHAAARAAREITETREWASRIVFWC